jgi:hypothetical protein
VSYHDGQGLSGNRVKKLKCARLEPRRLYIRTRSLHSRTSHMHHFIHFAIYLRTNTGEPWGEAL